MAKKATSKKATAKKKSTKPAKTRGKKASSRSPSKKKAGAKTKAATSKKTVKSGTSRAKRKSRGRSGLGIRTQHVDFLTYKLEQVRVFYSDILELESEQKDADGLNYLNIRTSERSSIGFMPPHPDMLGEQPIPREPSLYFRVKDVELAYQQLLAKGVAFLGPPQEMPWGDRVVTTTDPEGRTIMLADLPRKKKVK